MKITSITDKLVDHDDEHAMGIAAYMTLFLLFEHLESKNILDSRTREELASVLIQTCKDNADARDKQNDNHGKRLWEVVATHIRGLTRI